MADRIGRFEILSKIGEGGMGTVFKARDPHINRIVAIKLLREGFDTHEMRERFMQEARSAGGLQNPYIVTIFELGEHQGAPFIVMEFLIGHPLDQLIKNRAAIPVVRKLELMEALCTGLAAAHRAGVVHRDIKPPNLMVIPDGLLKILDFGIARVGASEMTKVGMVIGTPNYMSPEQLNAEVIDKRTDIFAVGAVFYELFTYERAFPGNHTEAITKILTRDPAPLVKLCPGLDPAIEAIVAKALKKNARDRYQDVSEMRREIVKVRERLERDAPESLLDTLSDETVAADGEPGAPASSRMRSEMRRRAFAEVDAARRLFDQGAVGEALQRLEQFMPPNEFVTEALAALRERAEELDREARRSTAIGRALKAAGEAFDRGDFEAAIRASDEALLIDERLTDARNLRRRAHNALDEQRRQAALQRRIADTLTKARRMFAAGQRRPALDLLGSFEPPHPEIAAARSELQVEHEAIEQAARAREAERRRQEEERVAREAEERRAREEAARLAKERDDAARRAQEEAERAKAARELAALQAREAEERRRQEQERLAREEEERRARDEAARLAKEREEAARLVKEREQAARLAKEEAERREREAAERAAKELAARRAREEEERRRQEHARLAREAEERRVRDEAARLAKEREEAARLAKEREDAARLAKEREEAERLAKEREQAARLAKEEARRRERLAAEQAARELAARRAREEDDRARKADVERVAKNEAARAAEAAARVAQQPAHSKIAVEPKKLPAVTSSRAVGAAAALLLAAAAAGGLWKYLTPTQDTTQTISTPGPAPTIATTTMPPTPPNPADGTLVLDALPWAQIVRITDSNGKPQPLPDNATTPLTLSLPPGAYDVTLKNGSTRTVRAQVGTGQIAQPAPIDFGQIDAADYFRKLGW